MGSECFVHSCHTDLFPAALYRVAKAANRRSGPVNGVCEVGSDLDLSPDPGGTSGTPFDRAGSVAGGHANA